MVGKLGKKQIEILEFLRNYLSEKSYPPTVREICEAVGLKSTSSVHAHLNTLEKLGYIKRDPSKPRAIEIIGENFSISHREISDIPMIGYVAAGQPLFAEENIVDHMPIPADMLPNNNCFMLKVRGTSMINAGILDGDYVLVEQSSLANNGEIVVALIDDGATVKRFFKEEGIYRLQPENDNMDPIIVKSVTILGKVIGVFRFMR